MNRTIYFNYIGKKINEMASRIESRGKLNILDFNQHSEVFSKDIYQKVKQKNNISFMTFMLSIDWLYLIEVAIMNKNGEIELCF